MTPDFDGMALFVRIVEHNSISAAARSLGMQKSTLSRRLTALEEHLGAPLIRRSSRSLTLTDAGERYYARAAPIVAEAEALEEEARATTGTLAGLLRITATIGFGQTILTPLLCDFLRAHPRVRLDLRFTDRRVNLIEEGFDMAVRMGPLDDSDLAARPLCTVERIVCASPDYLGDQRAPESVEELSDHQCIVVAPELDVWVFETPQGRQEARVAWRLAAGNTVAARTAAVAGIGIVNLPRFTVAEDLAGGRLIPLLAATPPVPVQATALMPRSRTPSLAARALTDFLARQLYGRTL